MDTIWTTAGEDFQVLGQAFLATVLSITALTLLILCVLQGLEDRIFDHES